ncbi:hypothetical protein BCY89_18695 [Sphingobacterium siyangense]|uniref:Uncharacterized protein n=2 Tax=Sphingobacterium TaxID=28453 RepID=A0A420FDJ5_9SPHI|nr:MULTISPECIES: hypothetical protein [Sphingobacterium]MBB1646622.1 hypothetical protein [Sphingobacterium sp. UME9]QQT29532.1 hypothetical protein I6I99_19605 [Sphingobacterium multivorum]RKF30956.1 hypothetical protein BCY89_18695 [Sphingobacterium siyangense]
MSTLTRINAYMHLKKHIRMNVIADLDMSIFYFKKRPFIVMDLSNEKIYFNDSGLEWLRSEKQLEQPVQWTRSKYLPSKNWVGLAVNNERDDLIIQLIDEFYLATCDMLLINPISKGNSSCKLSY